MADVIFEDYTIKVQDAIEDKINIVLEECAGEVESQVKRNYDTSKRVDTGDTKNSFRHVVDKLLHESTVGSEEQNALWEEFGTGEFALKDNGRKGGWNYKDSAGNWHFTKGKTPGRHLWKAFSSLKTKIINHIKNEFKGF